MGGLGKEGYDTRMSSLERAILRTIAYYDLFSYPLTSFEVWKWLEGEPATLLEVRQTLRESAVLRDRLDEQDGWYFVRGNGGHIKERKERYRIAERKLRRARRVATLLVAMPFVRVIAVCNSLAYANARDSSDIDLFVIAEKGRIWTARLLTTGLTALLRLRPIPGKTRDRICLSFYVADETTDLRSIMQEGDRHMQYWVDHMVLLAGDPVVHETFRRTNSWHRERLPNLRGAVSSPQRRVGASVVSRTVRSIARVLFGHPAVETVARRIQRIRLPETLRAMEGKGTDVILSDTILKFHSNDRRAEYRERLGQRFHELQVA